MQMTRTKRAFEHVTTETLRENNDAVLVSIKRLLEDMGQADVARGVRFEATDDHVIVGRLEATPIDGRTDPMGRTISSPGGSKVVAVPASALEHVVVDADTPIDGLEVDLWTVTDADESAPLFAITPRIRQTMQFPVGDLGESEADE